MTGCRPVRLRFGARELGQCDPTVTRKSKANIQQLRGHTGPSSNFFQIWRLCPYRLERNSVPKQGRSGTINRATSTCGCMPGKSARRIAHRSKWNSGQAQACRSTPRTLPAIELVECLPPRELITSAASSTKFSEGGPHRNSFLNDIAWRNRGIFAE